MFPYEKALGDSREEKPPDKPKRPLIIVQVS